MVGHVEAAHEERQGLTGMERLSLRVSEMVNHPIAQLQRWVTIARLDSDGDREWHEVLGILADTDELELSHNDDGSVTVRWEEPEKKGRPGVDEWEQDSQVETDPWASDSRSAPF